MYIEGTDMKYTIEQLNDFMDKIQAYEKDIRIDRGKRYGTPDDTLGNVAEFGADGCIISMWECFMRLKNSGIHPILKVLLQVLVEDIRDGFGRPKDIEDIDNAVKDLRNFAAYILCLETRELGQGEYNIPPEDVTVCACAVNPPKVVPWESPESILTVPEVEE
jgi:hypothetical protein